MQLNPHRFLLTMLALLCLTTSARATVFNLTEFVDYQNWALGIEPEATLDNGGGFATSFKFTYGISALSNLQVGVGFGSGARAFRIGGSYTFDFIPDIEGQIGAGIALQGYYLNVVSPSSQTEITATPYIHKTFRPESGANFDPFIALPIGYAFTNGTYRTILVAVVGVYFPSNAHFGFTLEGDINLNNTDSTISGGLTYRD